MDALACKRNWAEVLPRLRELYERRGADRIFAACELPSPALERFRQAHAAAECGYPDPHERARFWDAYLAERAAVDDDSLPAAYLSEFDQGLYGGLLGGNVRFMVHPEIGWISSMLPPLLGESGEGLERLRFDPDHPWWQRYLRQLEVFASAGRGRWGISHFILIDSLNFAFELLGATATYLCVEERPEWIRQAVELAHELNVRVQRTFFEAVGTFQGGTFSNFAQWLPGRIVSESLDPFHMTSVDYFERWGREPAERMLGEFDGGVLHIHGNGRHLLPAASSLRGLKAILLLDDRGWPAAFEVRNTLRSQSGEVPLSLYVEYPAFAEALRRRELPGGVLYQVRHVPDLATANRLMQAVRAYRTD